MNQDARNWDTAKRLGVENLGERPTVRAKRTYEESDTQISFFKWWAMTYRAFRVPQCACFHIPNGSALGTGREDWQVTQRMIRGKRLKAEGLTGGVFDVFVMVPRAWSLDEALSRGTGHFGWCGLFLEFKRRDAVLRPDQISFKAAADSLGYATNVAWTAGEGIDIVTTYLTK